MERYSRQTLFSPVGEEGQKKLAHKHVLIVGLGALGTQSSEMLIRAGIGELTLVDRDYIEWSNLQRQYLYTEEDAANRAPKAIVAKRTLQKINSQTEINAHIMDVTAVELEKLVTDVDLILDGTDNFDTRMMMNDIAQKYHIPWIYGSCVGSYGLSLTILPEQPPCLHCLLKTLPVGGPTCDTAGIIQPAASQVVIHQTTEALKILTDQTDVLRNKLISFDVWTNQTVEMDVSEMKKSDCPSCGSAAMYPFLSYETQTKTAILCGRDSVQIRPSQKQDRNLQQMSERLQKTEGTVEANEFLLSYTIGDHRLVMFEDGRTLVHGTNDIEKAKTLYYRYLS